MTAEQHIDPARAPSEPPVAEERPRRYKRKQADPPQAPTGFRSTRRSSKAAKKAKRAEKAHRTKSAFATLVRRIGRGAATAVVVVVLGLLAAAIVWGLIVGVNAGARWYAKRQSDEQARVAALQRVRENLLVIGVNANQATGFLALRVDRKQSRVFGIAIPDGAFVEVPGQGYERIGDSYKAGADVSMSAVSNYLSVPFEYYVVVDDAVYRNMLTKQSVTGLMDAVTGTNLDTTASKELATILNGVSPKNVGLAPLPVRSITIGNQTYFEPQRDEIADLLLSWWGVHVGTGTQATRVIIYNGAGRPGIAGRAAQQLIKAGYRVVDTGNADKFAYAKTQIVLYRGSPQEAVRVKDILGVGEISSKPTDQDITDLIVVIGRDYTPPKTP